MKFCYVDERGTGDEPYAVMVGVLIDAARMKPTKGDWEGFLQGLSKELRREIKEIHTRDFYAGNGLWRGLDGATRSRITEAILDWVADRKHSVIYSAVDKTAWFKQFQGDTRFNDLKTIWRFLGLHLVLGIQKHHQRIAKNKGNTVLVFDNELSEQRKFTDLILRPPSWTDTYYGRRGNEPQLDQIIDVPHFADSMDVPLLQVADFIAYFLRRYAELENGGAERYSGERVKVAAWAKKARNLSISHSAIYPKVGRCSCADLFHSYAPDCLLN